MSYSIKYKNLILDIKIDEVKLKINSEALFLLDRINYDVGECVVIDFGYTGVCKINIDDILYNCNVKDLSFEDEPEYVLYYTCHQLKNGLYGDLGSFKDWHENNKKYLKTLILY